MPGIFRDKIAVRFRPSASQETMFVEFAEAGGNGSTKFDWDESIIIALSKTEVAEVIGALREYGILGKIKHPVRFYHDTGKSERTKGKDVKVFEVFSAKRKDSDEVLPVIRFMLNPIKSKKTGKLKTDASFMLTLTRGEAAYLEEVFRAFLFMISIPTINPVNVYQTDEETVGESDVEDEDDEFDPDEVLDKYVEEEEEEEVPAPKKTSRKKKSTKSKSRKSKKAEPEEEEVDLDEVEEEEVEELFDE